MPRVVGVDLPGNKRIAIGLRKIYGVGHRSSEEIVVKSRISCDRRVKSLTEDEISLLNSIVSSGYVVEGDLRRVVRGNIKELRSIKCYRGMRHSQGRPVRGQRTHTNARTWKGRRPPVAGKRKG